MSLGWDTYLYQMEDGRPAAITLDLDITPEDGAELPLLVRARLALANPSEHGLMVEGETDALAEAEEAFEILVDSLSDGNGLFVGTLTMAGQCILHAYLPENSEIPKDATLGGYVTQLHTQTDPDWKAFFEGLFPAEDQLQCIINRRIVGELEEAGDDVSRPRPVRHSAFFPNQNAARAFVDGAQEEGFQVDSTDVAEDGSAVVHLLCEEGVELQAINERTLELVHLAGTCGGYYDGWETQLLAQTH